MPDKFGKIWKERIDGNSMIDNDYSFGGETTDFERPYISSKFTEKLQNTFEQ